MLTAKDKSPSSNQKEPKENKIDYSKLTSGRTAAICHGTCNCNVCKTTTDNIRRVGEVNVLRPFLEEANFRRFASSTKTLENHIDMNNLDSQTKEVIRYYQKLKGVDDVEDQP